MTKANLYEMFISPLMDDNITLDKASELMDPWTDCVCTINDRDKVPESKRILLYKKSISDMNDPDYNGEPDKDTVAAFAYGLSLSLFKE